MQKVRLSDLGVLAHEVLTMLKPGKEATVVALYGELGAGKTTFVQTLARELGVVEAVQSPTYVLMKRYNAQNEQFRTLIHIDAYRLESPEKFSALKPEQFLGDPKALVLVEWPERIQGALPAPDIEIKFSSEGAEAGERYIEVTYG